MRSTEETRRAFLPRLARAAVFVPPAVATLFVDEAAAQGKGSSVSGGGGKGAGQAPPWSRPPPTQTGR